MACRVKDHVPKFAFVHGTHRILDTERNVLFLRRLGCQNQLHSFPKRGGFGDDAGYFDTSGDPNASLRDPVEL